MSITHISPVEQDLRAANADLRAEIKSLEATNKELLEALIAYAPFIPTTSAADGGAAKHSANVRAADIVRAAIARATKGEAK